MGKHSARSLSEILQSTSDCLFPAELGERIVHMDSVDCDGDTALHVLAWRNDTEGALLLIECGANVDAVGDMGETPLHVALRKSNRLIVEALINAGAKVDIVSEFGQSAVDVAAQCGIQIPKRA